MLRYEMRIFAFINYYTILSTFMKYSNYINDGAFDYHLSPQSNKNPSTFKRMYIHINSSPFFLQHFVVGKGTRQEKNER